MPASNPARSDLGSALDHQGEGGQVGVTVAASHLLNLSGLIDDVVDGHLGGAGVQLDVFRVGVLDAIRQLME